MIYAKAKDNGKEADVKVKGETNTVLLELGTIIHSISVTRGWTYIELFEFMYIAIKEHREEILREVREVREANDTNKLFQ